MSAEEGQYNVQGYNIVTILKRLEAATSRLEDITIYQEEANKKRIANEPKTTIDTSTSVKTIQSTPEEKPKSVLVFEQFVSEHVVPFAETSKSIDSLLGEVGQLLVDAFKLQSSFLEIVAKSKKPDMNDQTFLQVLEPMNKRINSIIEIKEANRTSNFFNHLNTISEGVPVLGWIVNETPVSLIPEFKDSSKFWSDRVLKEYKHKDEKHVEWVNQFMNIFDELKKYVKEYHATGPSWNAKGLHLEEVVKATQGKPSTEGGAAPPPPPPPPPPPANLFDDASSSKPAAPAGGINAVFAEINKGSDITSGLKKVDKSEMTHKNPELRKQPPVAPKKPQSLSTASTSNVQTHAVTAAPSAKPPKKELIDGTKWVIQNYTKSDTSEPIVIPVEMHQSVFIGNCQDITIQLQGKANAVSLSETKKVALVIDSLISGVDVIKSVKFGLQVTGFVPMISIDKSDEGSVYLSKESVDGDIQVFTSSTTALNINVPVEDDYSELAVPEQFVHRVKDGKLVSEIVEHAG